MTNKLAADGKQRWTGPGCDPMPRIEENWGPLELSKFQIFSAEARAEAVERLAEQQDVKTLGMLLPSLVGAKAEIEPVMHRIIYATSHMLVDGGGNEEFARNWQDELGHTPTIAYQHASSKWQALVSTRSQIETQRFIGTACVAGPVFERYGGAPEGRVKDLSWFLLENSTPHRVMVLEEILRNKHPEQLPDAALDGVSGKVVCIAERLILKQPTFLEAIERVYGTDHVVVGQQMRDSFLKAIASVDVNFNDRNFWLALQKWGGVEHAEAVMGSTYNVASSDDEDQTPKPMFEAVMHGAGPTLGREIAITGVMLGLDVNRAYPPHGERFIDVAVDRNDEYLFTWLIARGADPELKSSHPDHPQSAVDRLERKKNSFAPDIARSATEMNDVLLKWRAHREAQRVIAELGDFMANNRAAP